MCFFNPPKAPQIIQQAPPPAPAQTNVSRSSRRATSSQKRKKAGSFGQQSTLLGSPLGSQPPQLPGGKKSLLGGG